jgi:CheY-like chemotaxis protein
LKISSGRDLAPASVDPNQLELAILNLCVNARDAMPEGGRLTVALEQELVGPNNRLGLAHGAYLRLSVIDTGCGMEEATLARAVEPFFSTKDVGRGTGLGLSMVHGLAAQMGGGFDLSSKRGHGTRADLYLPAAEGAVGARRSGPTPVVTPLSRPLKILLVDDEDLVRTGTAEMLRDLGHVVCEAEGGAEALQRLTTDGPVDVVVTDYMMPHMDGAELARVLAEREPDLPVLIVTGYAGGDLKLDRPQLAKPFRQNDLAAAINRLFQQGENVVAFPRRG